MGQDRRELNMAALGLAVCALYILLVLASGQVDPVDFALLAGTYLGGSFALWACIGLVGLVVMIGRHAFAPLAVERPSPIGLVRDYLGRRWNRDRFVSLLFPPLLFALLMAGFNAFKQRVLIDAGFGLDPLFARADQLLFLGHDPWRVTHALLPSPWATYAIDQAYHGWFAPMSVGVVLCAWLPRASWRLRTQYLLSYLAIWIGIGSVLAYLLPAAGPCFYAAFGHGEHFRPLLDRLAADQAVLQAGAPGTRLVTPGIEASLLRLYGSKHLVIGAGISAMPSVHNALSALFALAAFRINRVAGWALATYAVLIWIGSIDLGWHYAIDGIVAVALTFGIWRVAGRIAGWLDRAPPQRSGDPIRRPATAD